MGDVALDVSSFIMGGSVTYQQEGSEFEPFDPGLPVSPSGPPTFSHSPMTCRIG